MATARHVFALEPLQLPANAVQVANDALALERAGNWALEGETYWSLADQLDGTIDFETQAKLQARAAACFEISGETRAAARAYDNAANILLRNELRTQISAELFNRAAIQYVLSNEYFFAGTCWRTAGLQFSKLLDEGVTCTENLSPLPMSGYRVAVSGYCYMAAGEVFERAAGNEMWAVMAYWEAGTAFRAGITTDHSSRAYKSALEACIRYYGTLDLDDLQRILPLTAEQRRLKLNPFDMIEDLVVQSRTSNATRNNLTNDVRPVVDQEMIKMFHRFSHLLGQIGNLREASQMRVMERERRRKLFLHERSLASALSYWLWRQTSAYGESLGRWALVCVMTIISFGGLFNGLHLVRGAKEVYDYYYFSAVTFSTLGYGDMSPDGALGKSLACVEVLVGFVMFGLLLSFVGSKFQRV